MSAGSRAAAVLVGALLVGCYWSSAVRHATPIVRDGWDVDERGAWVVLTGPGASIWAGLDLVVRAVLPIEPPEPSEKWFRFYTGPMLPIGQVGVLCHMETVTHVHTIRLMTGATPFPARYRKWHFPLCIEALPGLYELEVHYFLRHTEDVRDETSTRHSESIEPSRVAWYAEAGGIYALRALVGGTEQASTPAPRSRVARRSSLGTSRFELEEGEWAAEIERLASWDALQGPVLEARASWERYESLRP